MKVISSATIALLLLCSSAALGQQPPARPAPVTAAPAVTLHTPLPTGGHFAPPNLTLPAVTPDLWLYSQEWRRHDDPAQAVRRKAEARTEQRMQRLAAMKWFGYSNSRPQASVTPFMSIYSPAWVGNGANRYDWVGVGYPETAVLIENYEIRR
jgi:hypothetical protein